MKPINETPEQIIARLTAENAALKTAQESGLKFTPHVYVRKDDSIGCSVNVGFPSSLSPAAARFVLANVDALRAAVETAEAMTQDPATVAKVRAKAADRAKRK